MEGNRRNFLNKYSNPQFKRKGVPSRERRHNYSLGQFSGNSDLSDTVYRILCYSKKIGSVIGKGGNIVTGLREKTQATITVTDSIPESDERIIIICSPSDKPANIQKIKNGDTFGKGDDVMEPHCAAQDALLRVHDRIVKEDLGVVESNGRDDLVVTARLLVSNSTVGCLLGKKGDVIQRLRSETGADIRVSPADHLPICANSNEELVQISGAPDIAKKALYEVSTRLHQNPRKDEPSLSFSSPYASQGFHPSGPEVRNMLRSGDISWSERNTDVYNSSPTPWRGGHVTRPSKFEPEDFDSIHLPHDHETLSEFSMKILCSAEKIGGVIGKGGLNVKLLERETGANVRVENASKESDERVVRVFSLEALWDQRSQTIDAILQLQNKTCELSEKGTVTTRLLVSSSKVGCILGQGGSIINEMRRRTHADIRVLSNEYKPKCAFDDEELVQICGSFGVARDALTEISLRLRTRCLRDATASVEPAPVRPIPRFDPARNLRGGLPRPSPIGAGSSGRYEHMTGGFRDINLQVILLLYGLLVTLLSMRMISFLEGGTMLSLLGGQERSSMIHILLVLILALRNISMLHEICIRCTHLLLDQIAILNQEPIRAITLLMVCTQMLVLTCPIRTQILHPLPTKTSIHSKVHTRTQVHRVHTRTQVHTVLTIINVHFE